MSETFFISDTHFGHKNIIKFEHDARPFDSIEEHDEALVDRWNAVVSKNSRVWHLGDAVFGKMNLAILGRLSGIKRLVLGNHDRYQIKDYLLYFTRVCGLAQFDGHILSHVPVHPCQFPRFKGNIHGHLHSKTILDNRYTNVCAERTNLTPVSYDQLNSLEMQESQ